MSSGLVKDVREEIERLLEANQSNEGTGEFTRLLDSGERSLAAGFRQHLTKPLDIEQLLRALETLLAGKALANAS